MKNFMNANTIEELKSFGKLVEVRAMFKAETEGLEGTFKTRSWADMLESIQTAREMLQTEEATETEETAPTEETETEATAEEPEAEEATETEETAQAEGTETEETAPADETVNPIIPVIEYEIPGSIPNFVFVSRAAEPDPEPEAEKPSMAETFRSAAGTVGSFAKAALPVLGSLVHLAGTALIGIGKLLILLLFQVDDLLHCLRVYGPDAGRAVLRWLGSVAAPAAGNAWRAVAGFAGYAACTVVAAADFLRLLAWNAAASAVDSARAGWSFREELIQETKAA